MFIVRKRDGDSIVTDLKLMWLQECVVAGASNNMKPDAVMADGLRCHRQENDGQRSQRQEAHRSGRTHDEKLETTCPSSLTWNLAVLMLETQWSAMCCGQPVFGSGT
jgi:hypothetical protein